MKTVKTLAVFVATFALTSFIFLKTEATQVAGVYGEKNMFEIVLHEDHSFTYFDNSNNKNIQATGQWEIAEKEIILVNDTDKKIISTWKVENGGNCIKSKKGMTFFTLCKKCE